VPSSSQPKITPPQPRSSSRQALYAWIWIGFFCLAALIATYLMFVEPPPPHKIVIATGGQNGAYFHYAQKYAEDLKKDGLTVEVRETAGSVENLRLLGQNDSGVAVAIVQSGVARAEEVSQFWALGSLYREPLWVFYRGDKRIERLSELAGKRIGVGPPGSGTHAIAMQLLAVNGLVESNAANGKSGAVLVEESVATAAKSLQKGDLDAAFFVAAFDAAYIQELQKDRSVKLLNFDQHEAYHRRFRFLSPVTVPAGMVNLSQNIPAQDVNLLAPTAMLVVRKDFHPALVPLLLRTATRIHGKGDELSNPGEFPSEMFCDFSISEDASRFYKSGQPALQRLKKADELLKAKKWKEAIETLNKASDSLGGIRIIRDGLQQAQLGIESDGLLKKAPELLKDKKWDDAFNAYKRLMQILGETDEVKKGIAAAQAGYAEEHKTAAPTGPTDEPKK